MHDIHDPQPSVLPVAMPLRGRPVLVLGGGAEAEEKTEKILARGARVTLVWPNVTARLSALAIAGRITWFAREFQPSDVQGAHLVMLTEIDEPLAQRVTALRHTGRFWLCAIDQPAYSDLYMVSTVMRGPVQIGISTGGSAPLLARRIREALEAGLDARFGKFAATLARLRALLREKSKEERRDSLQRALNGFAMEVRLSYPAEEGLASEEDQSGRTSRRSDVMKP